MVHRFALLFVLACVFSAGFASAQVTVVDATAESTASRSADTAARAASSASPSYNPQGELFYKLQLLQDEVMQLRGIVEEQQHTIGQLKQQRLDDYLNLDKRISELSTAPQSGGVYQDVTSAALADNKSTSVSPGVSASDKEGDAYQAAYGLVKQQDFKAAKLAFQQFVKDYPEGSYLPNALYWLGELYLLDPDLDSAQKTFARLLDEYPQHRKVPDAMFKLAKVYDLQGESAKAQALLKRVVSTYGESGSSAVKLARDYLDKNFK